MASKIDERDACKHPIQPLGLDPNGVLRFKENKIVSFLLKTSVNDLNKLIMMNFSQEDWEQFNQLIGYSLSGFGDLSCVRDEVYETAEAMYEDKENNELKVRLKLMEERFQRVKEALVPISKTILDVVANVHAEDVDDLVDR